MSNAVELRNLASAGEPTLAIGGSAPPRVGLLAGVTPPYTSVQDEIRKIESAVSLGVVTVTDLSVGPTSPLRTEIIGQVPCAVGTVPAYEVFARFKRGESDLAKLVMQVIERQIDEGVSFFSIHPSLSRKLAEQALAGNRIIPITSRGGGMLLEMLQKEGCENPFLQHWDEIAELCAGRGVVLSLVGSLRPGAIGDALEPLHLSELMLQAELVQRAHAKGAGILIELLNHVTLSKLPTYMVLADALFDGAPVGALGPSPTDIAVGLDDIAGAIGAAVAVWHGAAWINCTTAGEHTHLPTLEESLRAVRQFILAAHIGAIARAGGSERDNALSRARAANRWHEMENLSIFPEVAGEIFSQYNYRDGMPCTMCGAECPLIRARRHMQWLPSAGW